MNSTDERHPIIAMNEGTQVLREQAKAAQDQASRGVSQARNAAEALAALDMEQAFRQLRQMVSLLTERTDITTTPAQHADNVVPFPGAQRQAPLPLAAE